MSVLELTLRERIRRDYSAEGMEELFLRLDLLPTQFRQSAPHLR